MSFEIPSNWLERQRFAGQCDDYLEALNGDGFEMPLTYREAAEHLGIDVLCRTVVRVTWWEPRPVGGKADRVRVTAEFGHICQQLRKQGQVPCQIITAIEIARPSVIEALTVAAML